MKTEFPGVETYRIALLDEYTEHTVTGLSEKLPYGEELITLFERAVAAGEVAVVTIRVKSDERPPCYAHKWDVILFPLDSRLARTIMVKSDTVYVNGRIANGGLMRVRLGIEPTGDASLKFTER